jgi:hypothetical protein
VGGGTSSSWSHHVGVTTLAVALYSAKVHCRLNMTNLLFPDSFIREAADFFSSLRPSPPATYLSLL